LKPNTVNTTIDLHGGMPVPCAIQKLHEAPCAGSSSSHAAPPGSCTLHHALLEGTNVPRCIHLNQDVRTPDRGQSNQNEDPDSPKHINVQVIHTLLADHHKPVNNPHQKHDHTAIAQTPANVCAGPEPTLAIDELPHFIHQSIVLIDIAKRGQDFIVRGECLGIARNPNLLRPCWHAGCRCQD